MRNLNTGFTFLVMLCFTISGLKAQNAIPVAGGDATGPGGSVSYSVGQVWYTEISNQDATIFQGIQHPYEILNITGYRSNPGITLNAIIYPNPLVDFVNLKVENQSMNGLRYQLYNLDGELLEQEDITTNETRIDMSHRGASTYLIRITREDENIKTYKIIKH